MKARYWHYTCSHTCQISLVPIGSYEKFK